MLLLKFVPKYYFLFNIVDSCVCTSKNECIWFYCTSKIYNIGTGLSIVHQIVSLQWFHALEMWYLHLVAHKNENNFLCFRYFWYFWKRFVLLQRTHLHMMTWKFVSWKNSDWTSGVLKKQCCTSVTTFKRKLGCGIENKESKSKKIARCV